MKKKDEATDTQEFSGAPKAPPAVTPLDIQQKEFRVARFGGYRMRDVDEFLDELTEAMSRLLEENQRLRAMGGPAVAPSAIGGPDLQAVSRQAEEIMERARAEAARIAQEAREQAATSSTATGPGSMTEADRIAVTAFLPREREFLQSLGTLIQRHAESVKEMARAAKRAKPVGRPAEPESKPVAAPTSASGAENRETTTEERHEPPAERAGGPESKEQPQPPTEGPSTEATRQQPQPPTEGASVEGKPAPKSAATEEPVRLEEPAPAAVKAEEEVSREPRDGSVREPREGSLRELFWGED